MTPCQWMVVGDRQLVAEYDPDRVALADPNLGAGHLAVVAPGADRLAGHHIPVELGCSQDIFTELGLRRRFLTQQVPRFDDPGGGSQRVGGDAGRTGSDQVAARTRLETAQADPPKVIPGIAKDLLAIVASQPGCGIARPGRRGGARTYVTYYTY